jgi:hypothetical protein
MCRESRRGLKGRCGGDSGKGRVVLVDVEGGN